MSYARLSRDLWRFTGSSTRIKDAGIAIRHSRRRILVYTAGSRNGLERVVGHGPGHKKEVDPKKKTLFCYRKIYWGRQTGWKTRPGSAGSDNEVIWSCKRRVTEEFVQIWSNLDPNDQKSRFQLFGFWKSDGFPPEANASLLATRF